MAAENRDVVRDLLTELSGLDDSSIVGDDSDAAELLIAYRAAAKAALDAHHQRLGSRRTQVRILLQHLSHDWLDADATVAYRALSAWCEGTGL